MGDLFGHELFHGEPGLVSTTRNGISGEGQLQCCGINAENIQEMSPGLISVISAGTTTLVSKASCSVGWKEQIPCLSLYVARNDTHT